jgi:hypothetical protein
MERYTRVRNGFVVVTVLLFGSLASAYLRRGVWNAEIGAIFFLSQVAFWASWTYYSR